MYGNFHILTSHMAKLSLWLGQPIETPTTAQTISFIPVPWITCCKQLPDRVFCSLDTGENVCSCGVIEHGTCYMLIPITEIHDLHRMPSFCIEGHLHVYTVHVLYREESGGGRGIVGTAPQVRLPGKRKAGARVSR